MRASSRVDPRLLSSDLEGITDVDQMREIAIERTKEKIDLAHTMTQTLEDLTKKVHEAEAGKQLRRIYQLELELKEKEQELEETRQRLAYFEKIATSIPGASAPNPIPHGRSGSRQRTR
jgi:predicted RNase H-like nuclease (RuvC/YqgF family)